MSAGAPSAPSPAAVPTCDALPPGARLEQFEIERMLGASGFGIVYLASDPQTGHRVAIKEYLPVSLALRADDGVQVLLRAPRHAAPFERGRRAFLDEAQFFARCDHPSLLHVLNSWEANGTAYRAMPYYPGANLLALRQAMDHPPDEASLRALLDALLDALEVLHRAGRVHGDISPRNIVLLPDDRPVLLDFGDARHAIVGQQTQTLMTLVEPTFAPIEQFGAAPGRQVGPWTDLYSLAATVHFCLSGRLPAAASGWVPEPLEPLAHVVRRLRQLSPFAHYSASFLAAIDAALAVQPQDRPQSVQEFRAALRAPQERSAGRIEPELAPEAPAHFSSITPTEGETVPWQPTAAALPEWAPTIEPALAPAAIAPPASPTSWRDEAPPHASTPRARSPYVGAWLLAALALVAVGAGGWMLAQRQAESTEPSAVMARAARQDAAVNPSDAPVGDAPAQQGPVAPPVASPPTVAPAAEPAGDAVAGTGLSAVDVPVAPTGAVPAGGATPAAGASAAAPPRSATTRIGGQRTSNATSPREVCGARTQFALYRCMKTQCARPAWSQHAQCKRLRERDELD